MSPTTPSNAPPRGLDARTFGVFFGLLFMLMAAHANSETARDALFLSRLPATRLAMAYLIIAVVAVAVVQVTRLLFPRTKNRHRALGATLAGAALVNVGFSAWLADPGETAAFVYYIFTGIVSTVAVMQFWLLIGAQVDVRTAKSTYGPIAAAGVAGAAVGAVSAGQLLRYVDPYQLLWASAGALGIAAVLAVCLPRPPAPTTRRRDEDDGGDDRPGYLRRLLLIALVSTVTLTFIDFAFKLAVARHFDGDAAAIGGFLANYYGVINVIALATQLFIAAPLLRALGVNRALLLFPGLLLLGLLALAALPVVPTLFALVGLKGLDGALRHSVQRSATEVLYLPLRERVREGHKTIVDIVGVRGGQALASLGLLAWVTLGLDPIAIASVASVLAVVWLLAVIGVQKPYLDLFRRNLEERHTHSTARVGELDLHSLEVLIESLSSDDDARVLAALDLLAYMGKTSLVPTLVLYHPSFEVKTRALELLADDGDPRFVPTARRLFHGDDERVRAAALRAIHRVSSSADVLVEALDDPAPVVCATAMVGLVAVHEAHMGVNDDAGPAVGSSASFAASLLSGGGAVRRRSGDRGGCPCDRMDIPGSLAKQVRHPSPEVRAAVARAMQERPRASFRGNLLELSSATEPEVQVAVAGAMAARPDPLFAPLLIPWLARGATRSAARQALVAIGEDALAELGHALENPALPRRVRRHIPLTISRFPFHEAWNLLMKHHAREDDLGLRFRILRGLGRLRARHPDARVDRAPLLDMLRSALVTAAEALDARLVLSVDADVDIGDDDYGNNERPSAPTEYDPNTDADGRSLASSNLIVAALREREGQAIESVFRVLGLLRPDEDFRAIYGAIRRSDPRRRAEALELLEHVAPASARGPLMALVSDDDDAARRDRAYDTLGITTRMTAETALTVLLERGSLAAQAIAARHAAELGLSDLRNAMEAARTEVPQTRGRFAATLEAAIVSLGADAPDAA